MSETFERGKGLMAMENEGFCDEEERRQRGRPSNKFLSPPSHQKPSLKQGHLDSKLKKSPSLMKMIQMILCQDDASSSVSTLETKNRLQLGNKKDKKLKPTNFAALRLRIGSWEHKSNSAGLGLKAKIYFARQQLIWELLDGDKKYKIEIEWSSITALNANCPHNQPGTLRVVLHKQPRLFKETDPEPKKQTRWVQTDDFTGSQASTYKEHFLEFPQGVLDKHYEKLIQCDTRLRLLSQLPDTILDSPKFEAKACNSIELSDNVVNQFQTARKPLMGFFGKVHEGLPKDDVSPTSVIGSCATKVNANNEVHKFQNLNDLQQLGVPVLRPSLSIDDRVGYVEPFFETYIDHDFEQFFPSFSAEHENKVHGDDVMVQEEDDLNDVTSHKQLQCMSDSSVDFLHEHFPEIPQGVLDKHYEKLIQCDTRLRRLSQLPEIILDSPKFAAKAPNSLELRDNDVNQFQIARKTLTGQEDIFGKVHEGLPKDNDSPPSVNANSEVHKFQNLKDLQQLGVPVLGPSLSIDDRVGGYVEPFFETDIDGYVEPFFETDIDHDCEEFFRSLWDENKVHGDDVMVQEESGEFFQSLWDENKVHGDDVIFQEESGRNDVTSQEQLQCMSDLSVEFLHGLPRAFLPHS